MASSFEKLDQTGLFLSFELRRSEEKSPEMLLKDFKKEEKLHF